MKTIIKLLVSTMLVGSLCYMNVGMAAANNEVNNAQVCTDGKSCTNVSEKTKNLAEKSQVKQTKHHRVWHKHPHSRKTAKRNRSH